jgi:putative copper export protein/methionine-rich copper-binding protein CopC
MLVGLMVALAALIGLAPGAASAENQVVNSSPSNGAVLNVSPDEIVIGFAEELGEANTISVDCEAEPVTLPRPEVLDDGTTLSVEIPEPLPSGTCTARWQVSNTDGEPDGRGVITFVVENAAPEGGVDPGATPVETTIAPVATPATTDDTGSNATASTSDGLVVVDFSVAGRGNGAVWLTRLISTLGIAVLFGSLVVITAAWPEGVEYLVTIRFLRATWVVALVGTLLFTGFAAASVTPEGGGSPFNPSTWLDLLDAGWAGRAVLARLVLLIASAWAAFRPERVIDPTTQLAALGIPGLCAATIGISRTVGDLVGLGILMGVLHALAMSVWVGGVILVARVVLSGPGDEDLVHAVRGFSRVSTPAIVVTIVTGLVQMFRLDGGELFQSGHGRVVVLKTVLVAVMIFVAFSARQFVTQRLNSAQQMSVPLSDRLRRAFGAEAALGIVVLALSAWLLAFIPPNINPTPSIDYAVSQTHTDEAGILDVVVRLTDDRVGLVGLEVELRKPEDNVAGLVVVLTAPPNDQNVGSIRQPVPLTQAGFAVRAEAVGLPISVAGDWTIQVEANTASGAHEYAAGVQGVQPRRLVAHHGGHGAADEPRRTRDDRPADDRRLTSGV